MTRGQPKGPAQATLAPSPELEMEHEVPIPSRLVRGEHREIEEEIANRILSDISEENSVAGSLASIDELEPPPRITKDVSF